MTDDDYLYDDEFDKTFTKKSAESQHGMKEKLIHFPSGQSWSTMFEIIDIKI